MGYRLPLCTLTILLYNSQLVTAQIIPDHTLPVNSQVQTGCTVCQIDGGTVKGTNLFHSFSQFSVPTGGKALFNNSANIQNIFTRVTGQSISNINGTIETLGKANLFFINPSGIIFGQNASLNIGGSFFASTANSIKFADGQEFHTYNTQNSPNTSLLTISTPIGLQFGSNSGLIQVKSQNLAVKPEQTLGLIGGNINLETATLKTHGGKLELGSVIGIATVNLISENTGFRLNYNQINTFGDIQLSSGSIIDTSNNKSGEIQIITGNLRLHQNSKIMSFNLGSQPGGTISINAKNAVEIIGTGDYEGNFSKLVNPYTDLSTINNAVLIVNSGTGNGTNLEINAGQLILDNGAFLLVSTIGAGNSGNLTINTSDTLQISNSLMTTSNRFGSVGNGGNINIQTKNLVMDNRSLLTSTTVGTGKAGNININAENIKLTGGKTFVEPFLKLSINTNINSATFSRGTAGNVNITTNGLLMENGGSISAGSTNSGRGGSLTVNATDIKIIGTAQDNINSGFFLPSFSTGDGGMLNISANRLQIRDTGTINLSATGTGNSGNINIQSQSIYLDNLATINANTKSKSANNQEQANINISGRDLIMRRQSSITTDASGDNIIGGNININTGVLVALENSDISANSTDFRGGRVTINAQGIFGTKFRSERTPESDITASSNLGNDFSGTVQVNVANIDTTNVLPLIPINLADAEFLLENHICDNDRINGNSYFVIIGKGGLPPKSDDLISNSPGIIEWSNRDNIDYKNPVVVDNLPTNSKTNQRVIQQAQGWVIDDRGKVILTAEAPQITTQNSGLNHPNCHH